MRGIDCWVVVALVSGLQGCSVHPLPQDVSFASTVQIVRRIRCEAKEGLLAALEKATSQNASKKKHVEKIVEGTTIGFEFMFAMAEDNKAAGGVLTFERGAAKAGDGFTLSLDAGLNSGHGTDDTRTRKNTRIFRVVDNLRELEDARCGQRVKATGPNLIHPITGSTGMAEVVRTYIELETLTDLTSVGVTKVTGKKGQQETEIITFSDNLQFTTTLEVGAFTDLDLETVVGSLRLTRASVTGSALRKDYHSVRVVLARDNAHLDLDLPENAGAARKAPTTTKKNVAEIEDVRDKRLQTFLAQRKALGRNRVVIELERQRLVDEDRAVAARVLGQPLP